MRIVGMLIAAVVALAAAFFAYNIMDKGEQVVTVQAAQQESNTVKILVAARDIELGDKLSAEDVTTADWPEHLATEATGFVSERDDIAIVVGRVARSPFVKDEPLNIKRLSNPEDPNFIAAQLPEGMRMATVSSDVVAGLAGFVYPGDRVDVLLTRKFPLKREVVDATGLNETSMSETLISNIRVLAVNQSATIDPEDANADNGMAKNDRIPSSVSLEVTASDAAKLRLGQETGYVTLALRSLKDKDAEPEHVLVTEPDVTVADDEGYVVNPFKLEQKEVVSLVLGTKQTVVQMKAKEEDEAESSMENDSQDESAHYEQVEQELEEIIE
ncbi:MAG: Flp pilus assembly protein CpaB [Alphaproteobacteria bacterium]|nr:MAG: Flp pilus assembly protein CpaB [Alphaproteobacteria bacterium]TAF14919.1 MAG: Flp pilus assembly protein CpaB [Alphaproteobacteria bacterium]TAF39383.1 MAG: Flp pilus assembly protein CpaB [Alphaproteobacteria bacterium]TAF77197.1 MAG: Flp pilus assembly protein CpaB [Alphaproteobacteria bacterium]